MNGLLFALTLAAALGSGVVAGIFYAFSTFVMKALGDVPPAHGLAAMQAINVRVIRPMFMLAFLGTVALSVLAVIVALVDWPDEGAGVWILVGAGLYVVGTFALTMVAHQPRNHAVARLDPADPDAPQQWSRLSAEWTAWNHVRTVAALAAAAAFTVALAV